MSTTSVFGLRRLDDGESNWAQYLRKLADQTEEILLHACPIGQEAWFPYVPAGWLWEDGRTIGSAASGATSRAHADTASLFTVLWENFSNAQLPIQDSSGNPTTRGGSAAADFAANRRMPLPDTRLQFVRATDNATVLMGATGGATSVTLTASNLPPHAHSMAHTHDLSNHTHTLTALPSLQYGFAGPPGSYGTYPNGETTITTSGPSPNVTGDASAANTGNGPGSSAPVSTLPPFHARFFCIRYARQATP